MECDWCDGLIAAATAAAGVLSWGCDWLGAARLSLGAQWSSYKVCCFANGCRFYPLFVKQCNKMDEIWVPSQFSVDVLRESGVGMHT